ncbi:MAG TPA: LacI family transcriptional regulator [Rhodospirillales bacterium]|nr:LacI family transcriptional regulator [Rhodospirillales bacterium]
MAAQNQRSRVTLRDIAQHVGVHTSTVSRVLNPSTRKMVTEKIAKKVTRAAEERGYRPNAFAQSLKTNRSFTVGVMVPDLTNPAFAPIIKGIDNVLEAAGYSVIVANTDNLVERERRSVEKFRERQVDGLVIATARRQSDLVADCRSEGTPFVLAVRSTTDIGASSVVSDEIIGGNMIISHLVKLGHKHIAYVAGPQFLSTGFERYQGYLQGLSNAGLKVNHDLVAIGGAFTEEEGRRATKRILENRQNVTAIVAANDLMALGCYDELMAKQLKCPEDISVVGFDDMPFTSHFNPPLTTVHTPLLYVGIEAARILLKQIEEPAIPAQTLKLRPELIVRMSTRVLNA